MARAKKNRNRTGRPRAARKVTLSDYGGDHGTGTLAAKAGTQLEEIKNQDGRNPNKQALRRRREAYTAIPMTTRQEQAAKAIRDAFCRKEALSSGGELKEQVDATPKPDAVVDMQCAVMSHWLYVMRPLASRKSLIVKARAIIEHVCCKNEPLRTLPDKHRKMSAQFYRAGLDLVANNLRY